MKNDITDKKKSIIIVTLGIIALCFLIYQIFFAKKASDNINIVTNPSKFYTVSNCVSRYINYLCSKDTDNILLLLNNSYKKKNSINKKNVFSKLESLNELYSFKPKKMYQEIVNKNVTKYYVYGSIYIDNMSNIIDDGEDYYIIVYLNKKDYTYSIEPYDGKLFLGGDAN